MSSSGRAVAIVGREHLGRRDAIPGAALREQPELLQLLGDVQAPGAPSPPCAARRRETRRLVSAECRLFLAGLT
jgi:hypothetical protein